MFARTLELPVLDELQRHISPRRGAGRAEACSPDRRGQRVAALSVLEAPPLRRRYIRPYTPAMVLQRLLGSALILCAASACASQNGSTTTSPSAAVSSATTTPSVLDALSGTWRSASASSTPGLCRDITYTLTPTGAASASVDYSATCASVGVRGSGSGTLSGTIVNWTTTGNAVVVAGAPPCPFNLAGTVAQGGAATVNVSYSGTICGVPVSGFDTLSR